MTDLEALIKAIEADADKSTNLQNGAALKMRNFIYEPRNDGRYNVIDVDTNELVMVVTEIVVE